MKVSSIDLSKFENQTILNQLGEGKIKPLTSWLGSRKVQLAEGQVDYQAFAARLHKAFEGADQLTLAKRLSNVDGIRLVQSFDSSTIRRVINLIAQFLFITRVFGYNQSLRDLENDRNKFLRVTKDIWDKYFSGCVESKVTIDGTEYYQVSERDLSRAVIQEKDQLTQNQQRELEERDKEIQTLKRDRAQRDNIKGGGEQKLITELYGKIEIQQRVITSLADSNRKLKTELGETGKKISELEQQLQNSKRKRTRARTTIQEQAGELTKLQSELTTLSNQVTEFVKKEKQWHQVRQELVEQRDQFSDELKGLKLKKALAS